MLGAVYKETLRQTWMQVLIWGAAFGALGILTIALVPDARGLAAMVELMESMPPFLVRMAGAGDDLAFMGTPEGFITVGFFGKALLFFAAYPVIMGLRVTINEEGNGTMDTLMSLPLLRWQMVLEKFTAYFTTLIMLVVLFLVCMIGGNALFDTGMSVEGLFNASIAIVPNMTFILAITTLAGAFIRERRQAVMVAVGFVIASFLVDTIGATAQGTILEQLRALSFFSYYDSTSVMQDGIVWAHVIVMFGLTALAIGASLWAFQRRDITV